MATDSIAIKKPAPPFDDKRWRIADATMRRHGHQPYALIAAAQQRPLQEVPAHA